MAKSPRSAKISSETKKEALHIMVNVLTRYEASEDYLALMLKRLTDNNIDPNIVYGKDCDRDFICVANLCGVDNTCHLNLCKVNGLPP
jgi:hypothetical protein